MAQTVVVSIPHRLGKEEAMRRLKSNFGRRPSFVGFAIKEEAWTDSQLRFDATLLGQSARGTVDVADDHVRIEVELPWLLAQLAEKAKALIQKETQFLLEKK